MKYNIQILDRKFDTFQLFVVQFRQQNYKTQSLAPKSCLAPEQDI